MQADKVQIGDQQLTLFSVSAVKPVDAGHASLVEAAIALQAPPLPPVNKTGLSVGDVVVVAPVSVHGNPMGGQIQGFTKAGMVLVNVGIPGNPYTCSATRLTVATTVALWRLGSAVQCDRSDCKFQRGVITFSCDDCGKRSEPLWWYVGAMGLQPTSPKWPDAVWFPAGYDPNARGCL